MEYDQSVRRELIDLIQKQIDILEKEILSNATDVERREYEERRKRIDELQRVNPAA